MRSHAATEHCGRGGLQSSQFVKIFRTTTTSRPGRIPPGGRWWTAPSRVSKTRRSGLWRVPGERSDVRRLRTGPRDEARLAGRHRRDGQTTARLLGRLPSSCRSPQVGLHRRLLRQRTGGFHAVPFILDATYDNEGRPIGLIVEDPATTLELMTPDKPALLTRAGEAAEFLASWRFGDWNQLRDPVHRCKADDHQLGQRRAHRRDRLSHDRPSALRRGCRRERARTLLGTSLWRYTTTIPS